MPTGAGDAVDGRRRRLAADAAARAAAARASFVYTLRVATARVARALAALEPKPQVLPCLQVLRPLWLLEPIEHTAH